MRGGPRKTRKRKPKKLPDEKTASEIVSSLATDSSDALLSSDFPILSQSTASPLASTPKRGRGQTRLLQEASTPDRSSSTDNQFSIFKSHPGAEQEQLENTTRIPEAYSPCSTPEAQSRLRKRHAVQPRQGRKRVTKAQTQTCSKSNGPPAKCRHRRGQQKEGGDLQQEATTQPPERCRPRFELQNPEATEQDRINQDETSLSSDLSIELSQREDQPASFSIQEDEEEEEEDEEELPSFLMQVDKKPLSITEGVFVWCKFRNYPFWPAMVKSVNRKQKKASIVFIDDPLTDNKRKGLTVALKTLKPFDCEEANQLVCKAKENYGAAIEWSLELITDYRIRIACGSFTGSFIEYFAHNMSYPVRRKYPQAVSERLTIASEMAMEVQCDNHKEESFIEVQEEVSRSSKRLLPDRTHAAHNRANEKLVHFIVKQRMVERHILAVISGQQQSRWLRSFLSAKRRRVVNIYLEDDEQLDQVYWYLNELYETAPATAPCLADVKFMERVPFVLDVLLPEAIIYAIAGVDNVSVKKAEEKYLKGRCISNRERQEFDWMIEQQMRTKSMRQNTHSYSTSPLLL
ncbi:PWWP domain-containing DNA repair factor 3B-like isoform X2 [Centroberyx affinis]|uniref:PWWP domain-containing DNA repair factor 3B-like isoform X2 n=1 Tax=Centroberyx affinis TaxID=166261 RepID=UPI003A5C0349